jgi:hypothetical protein
MLSNGKRGQIVQTKALMTVGKQCIPMEERGPIVQTKALMTVGEQCIPMKERSANWPPNVQVEGRRQCIPMEARGQWSSGHQMYRQGYERSSEAQSRVRVVGQSTVKGISGRSKYSQGYERSSEALVEGRRQ